MCAHFNSESLPAVLADVRPFSVPLKQSAYSVFVGRDLLTRISPLLQSLHLGRRCAIVTDNHVGSHYADILMKALQSADYDATLVTIPAGEPSKCMAKANDICDKLIAARLDRSSFLLALGGGVIGDLTGFVAAIYYRGIPFIQIPTTIMAQVDSSVGGKTGVNASAGKNLIGAFHQPAAVLADLNTLQTLPKRVFCEGFSEVIKHGIIRDASLLDLLEDVDHLDLEQIIPRNIHIKASIVCEDEKELTGTRALLNFGHTLGHAIEHAAGYGSLLHGEAISLGIIAACRLSEQLAGFPAKDTHRIITLLKKFELPTQLPSVLDFHQIEQAMQLDKKFDNGKIRFVLSSKLGHAFLSEEVTLHHIREVVDFLQNGE